MEHVDAVGGWYWEDVEREITPEYVMGVITAISDPRSDFYALMRRENVPANELMGRRMEIGVLAVLGQLRARRNWHRIAREWWFGDEPATELGRAGARLLGAPRRDAAARGPYPRRWRPASQRAGVPAGLEHRRRRTSSASARTAAGRHAGTADRLASRGQRRARSGQGAALLRRLLGRQLRPSTTPSAISAVLPACEQGCIAGEWTPRYMYDVWTPGLLARGAPEAKTPGQPARPARALPLALAHGDRVLPRPDAFLGRVAAIGLSRSLYADPLARVLAHFDPEQVLVLQMERCIDDPAADLRRTFEFLGVDRGLRAARRNCPSERGPSRASTPPPALEADVRRDLRRRRPKPGGASTRFRPDPMAERQQINADLDLGPGT